MAVSLASFSRWLTVMPGLFITLGQYMTNTNGWRNIKANLIMFIILLILLIVFIAVTMGVTNDLKEIQNVEDAKKKGRDTIHALGWIASITFVAAMYILAFKPWMVHSMPLAPRRYY